MTKFIATPQIHSFLNRINATILLCLRQIYHRDYLNKYNNIAYFLSHDHARCQFGLKDPISCIFSIKMAKSLSTQLILASMLQKFTWLRILAAQASTYSLQMLLDLQDR